MFVRRNPVYEPYASKCPTARRREAPCIKVWKFDIRIPFVHYEWEIPEMIQACVVFLYRYRRHPILTGFVWVYL